MSNKTLAYSILGIILAAVILVLAIRMINSNKQEQDLLGQVQNQAQEQERQPSQPADNPEAGSSQTLPPADPAGSRARNYDDDLFKTFQPDMKNTKVEMTIKDYGKIVVQLDAEAAPKTAENFLKLAQSGFYNCLNFHRVAKNFVIQGGDPKGDGTGGPGYTVPAEIKLNHKRGSIAMARLPDQVNPSRDSSGSQFYIALNDLQGLDGQYTVFGQVVEGMDVVDKIGQVEINSPYGDGQPLTPVVIESAKIIN